MGTRPTAVREVSRELSKLRAGRGRATSAYGADEGDRVSVRIRDPEMPAPRRVLRRTLDSTARGLQIGMQRVRIGHVEEQDVSATWVRIHRGYLEVQAHAAEGGGDDAFRAGLLFE